MPAGDPAGYLPNVIKSRKQKQYKGRRRKMKPGVGAPLGDARTGGTQAPSFLPPKRASGRPGFKPMPPYAKDRPRKFRPFKGRKTGA